MKKALLIDGHNLLFKYFSGMPRTIFSTDGTLIHGAYGMIATILKYLQKWKPDIVIVCFDSQIPSERTDMLPTYKANRTHAFAADDPNNPFSQIDIIQEALHILTIPFVEAPGIEADDLIGSYARILAFDHEVTIMSNDRDYIQLVDKRISIYMKRGKEEKCFTPELVKEMYGVDPEQYVDMRSLTGDASDNIQGITGIGPKTASALLQRHGSIATLYDHLSELKPKLSEMLQTHQQMVRTNQQLITIQIHYPVDMAILEQFSQKAISVSVQQTFIQLGLFQAKSLPAKPVQATLIDVLA